MSRWSNGYWAMAALVADDDGDVYPLSKLAERCGLKVEGFYEERGWFASRYYAMDDLTGSMGHRYEGSFDIYAHLRITDRSGRTKDHEVLCQGYTCCGRDCYMLLMLNPAANAEDTTVEFQKVEKVEIIEAVGEKAFNDWWRSPDSDNPRLLDEAPF